MIKNHKMLFVVAALCLCILFWARCMQKSELPDARGNTYAAPGTCKQCHQGIVDSSLSNAHHMASAEATAKTLVGHFTSPKNLFAYSPQQRISMEHRDSGFYQVLYTNGKESEAHRFDIIFGITHAQTSLYWLDDVAYELPLSFYTSADSWATSPGFSASIPDFKRLIGRDCFECHSSNISNRKDPAGTGDYFSTAEQVERMEKRSLIYGIDCQRCHGPAAEHVNFHQEHPAEKRAKFMVAIGSLSRKQQLDVCAQCHSGNDQRKLRSRFGFKPGDDLSDFFMAKAATPGSKSPDVHGNQFNLLAQSACYLQSQQLTCSSCHNPHTNATEGKELYSNKCMNCHAENSNRFCTVKSPAADLLKQNCIDCHMPKQSSEAISFELAGSNKLSSYLLTTHRIAVYDTSSKIKR